MRPDALAHPFPVATYGFNVPCRKFLVTANVTTDRRLPMVDEFALRLLKLGERLPVDRLARFMGLDDDEISVVVIDLMQRGLVDLDGDHVALHASTHDHFRGATDGIPRILEVDTWIEHVWFDLISRSIVASGAARPAPNLVDVRASASSRELSPALARQAFEDGFVDYLARVRRINNPDRVSLYAVSAIVPGRYGTLTFEGADYLSLNPEPTVASRLLHEAPSRIGRHRPLVDALADAHKVLDHPPPASAAALSDYSRLTGSRPEQLSVGQGRCDLPGWLRAEAARSGPLRQPLVGASYIPRNVEVLCRVISAAAGVSQRDQRRALDLLWLRPGGSAWGRSPDLGNALDLVCQELVKRLGKGTAIRRCLVVPQTERHDDQRRFDRLFDAAVLAPSDFASPALEILHVPGVVAVVMIRQTLAPSVGTSVGIAAATTTALHQVDKRLGRAVENMRNFWGLGSADRGRKRRERSQTR